MYFTVRNFVNMHSYLKKQKKNINFKLLVHVFMLFLLITVGHFGILQYHVRDFRS